MTTRSEERCWLVHFNIKNGEERKQKGMAGEERRDKEWKREFCDSKGGGDGAATNEEGERCKELRVEERQC